MENMCRELALNLTKFLVSNKIDVEGLDISEITKNFNDIENSTE